MFPYVLELRLPVPCWAPSGPGPALVPHPQLACASSALPCWLTRLLVRPGPSLERSEAGVDDFACCQTTRCRMYPSSRSRPSDDQGGRGGKHTTSAGARVVILSLGGRREGEGRTERQQLALGPGRPALYGRPPARKNIPRPPVMSSRELELPEELQILVTTSSRTRVSQAGGRRPAR